MLENKVWMIINCTVMCFLKSHIRQSQLAGTFIS